MGFNAFIIFFFGGGSRVVLRIWGLCFIFSSVEGIHLTSLYDFWVKQPLKVSSLDLIVLLTGFWCKRILSRIEVMN